MSENTNPVLPGDEVQDTEGHVYVESDDVEGHARMQFAEDTEDTDDVEGHVQPPRDMDIEH